MATAIVNYLGQRVGAVAQDSGDRPAIFEYDPDFLERGPELSPFMLPKRPGNFSFPALALDSFRGLPGMLSDALPDRFGNAVMDQRFIARGQDPARLTAVDRLSYPNEAEMVRRAREMLLGSTAGRGEGEARPAS